MMAEDRNRPRLGRGLAALIGDAGEETGAVERARGQKRISITFLRPNPKNPRMRFAEADLDDLVLRPRHDLHRLFVAAPTQHSIAQLEIDGMQLETIVRLRERLWMRSFTSRTSTASTAVRSSPCRNRRARARITSSICVNRGRQRWSRWR